MSSTIERHLDCAVSSRFGRVSVTTYECTCVMFYSSAGCPRIERLTSSVQSTQCHKACRLRMQGMELQQVSAPLWPLYPNTLLGLLVDHRIYSTKRTMPLISRSSRYQYRIGFGLCFICIVNEVGASGIVVSWRKRNKRS